MQRQSKLKANSLAKPKQTKPHHKRSITTTTTIKNQLKPTLSNIFTQQQRHNATTSKRIMCKASSKLGAGLVGLPNIGKSLIFNCLTNQNVPSQNYPFCTIDPTTAFIAVQDDRLETLRKISNSQNVINSTLSITDIAGLVRGASEGKGLGNEFLANIMAVDAIFHLVRLFPQPKRQDVEHVEGSIDPVRDMEIISNELIQKDKKQLQITLTKLQKQATKASVDPAALTQLTAVKKAMELVDKGHDIREGLYTQAEADSLVSIGLLSSKPVIYILNCSTEEYLSQHSPLLAEARAWIKKRSPGSTSILFSGDWEADLALIPQEEQGDYIKDMSEEYPLHSEHQPLIDYGDFIEPNSIQDQANELVAKSKSMIPAMVANAYTSLNLVQYFTTGPMETRSWSIPRGATGPEAAGVIHSDFEKNYVAAEVITYSDMTEHKDEEALKKLGKVKTQGKNYIVQDGDIIVFKTGVAKK
jgi:obg-like ATPase 1